MEMGQMQQRRQEKEEESWPRRWNGWMLQQQRCRWNGRSRYRTNTSGWSEEDRVYDFVMIDEALVFILVFGLVVMLSISHGYCRCFLFSFL